jgi:hypothetical protein
MIGKSLIALAMTAALAASAGALAQSPTEDYPPLTSEQSARVKDQVAAERRTIEARVASGEITPDEAERYLGWREWQIARQVAGVAPPPTVQAPARPPVRYADPYYYGAPGYYVAPRAYYWGPSICAGGWGHHGGGSICF